MVGLFILAILGISRPTICLDPGHPSEVGRGTQGKHLTEMGVAWDVANRLATRLKSDGYSVVLTKKSLDEKVLNKRRAEIANQSGAKLMLRLHCDAAAGSGFAVFYPTQQGQVDGIKGPSKDLLERTAPIAERFHAAMATALKGKLGDLGLKSDVATAVGSKQGALTGSIYSKVPAVLVEMVVLTNARDEAFIGSRDGMNAMVNALAKGVEAAVPTKS